MNFLLLELNLPFRLFNPQVLRLSELFDEGKLQFGNRVRVELINYFKIYYQIPWKLKFLQGARVTRVLLYR